MAKVRRRSLASPAERAEGEQVFADLRANGAAFQKMTVRYLRRGRRAMNSPRRTISFVG